MKEFYNVCWIVLILLLEKKQASIYMERIPDACLFIRLAEKSCFCFLIFKPQSEKF